MTIRTYYGFEPFYEDVVQSPLDILRLIVPIIAPWCVRYEAELLHPDMGERTISWRTRPEWKRAGTFDPQQTSVWLDAIIAWFITEGITKIGSDEKLLLFDANGHAIGQFNEGITVNWGIELLPNQYQIAQQAWVAQGFPADLFNADEPVCLPVDRPIFRALGFKKYMSKKQWEQQHASKTDYSLPRRA